MTCDIFWWTAKYAISQNVFICMYPFVFRQYIHVCKLMLCMSMYAWIYTCRIAVGIPKTAIGVTAILLTAVSETAMAAKN